MKADFKVYIDACVLVNFAVCGLLLRLAEKPRMFIPIWSDEILEEVSRAQVEKLGWPETLAKSFRREATASFPDSSTNDYSHITPQLTNHPKDRHVLAATVRAGSSLILTFNLKDFPQSSLEPWSVEAMHPQDYLAVLYELDEKQMVARIAGIAGERKIELFDVLIRLGKSCPIFAGKLIDDLNLA